MNNITGFDDLLDKKYGQKGTAGRDKYEADSLAFRLGAMLKEARKRAIMTQEELAQKPDQRKVISPELKEAKAIFKSPPIIN